MRCSQCIVNSYSVLKFGRICDPAPQVLDPAPLSGDPAPNVSDPPPIMSDQHNIELNEF